jgi:hypothetical protein
MNYCPLKKKRKCILWFRNQRTLLLTGKLLWINATDMTPTSVHVYFQNQQYHENSQSQNPVTLPRFKLCNPPAYMSIALQLHYRDEFY